MIMFFLVFFPVYHIFSKNNLFYLLFILFLSGQEEYRNRDTDYTLYTSHSIVCETLGEKFS